MPPKMEPQLLKGMLFLLADGFQGHQRPLNSSMDPFSRKSKPPDLNFIKKVSPKQKTKQKRMTTRNSLHKKNKQTDPAKHTNPAKQTNPTKHIRPDRHHTAKTPDANPRHGGMREAIE